MPFQVIESLAVLPYPPIWWARSAVLDASRDSVYFGYQNPSSGSEVNKVVRISLSDFAVTGCLSIPSLDRYDYLGIGFIDPNAGYMYFGRSLTGLLYKINLDTFVIDNILDLSGVLPIPLRQAGVIDPIGGYAYVGNCSAVGKIAKIDLSTFSVVDVLDTIAYMFCAVIDTENGFAYFGGKHDNLAKVEISPGFAHVDTLDLGGGQYLLGGAIDTARQLAYFSDWRYWRNGLYCVDLSSFTIAGFIEDIGFNTGNIAMPVVLDTLEGYMYLGEADFPPARIAVARLSDFVIEGMLCPQSSLYIMAGTIDVEGRNAYFGAEAIVHKIGILDVARTYFFHA